MDVIIEPVERPAKFEAFTEEEWKAARKLGPLKVADSTALENIRNSKGLYRIQPEKVATAQVELKRPEDMTLQELAQEMAAWGKPPQKQMSRKQATDAVLKFREQGAALIVDDGDAE